MKPLCARTVKGAIRWASVVAVVPVVFRLVQMILNTARVCLDDTDCQLWVPLTISVSLFLVIAFWILQRKLPICFPVACGHRRCIFTGRSSKNLKEILLSIDEGIPTEEQLHQFEDRALIYLNDIKAELEKEIPATTFQLIFAGSIVERCGIPFKFLDTNPTGYLSTIHAGCKRSSLDTDLDVMFCSLTEKACFSHQGNIHVEPLIAQGFTGYVKLTSLTPGLIGSCVSSKAIRDQAKKGVENARVSNLPGIPCCCGMIELTPKIQLHSKGPAMKIKIAPLFEVDITPCIQSVEWPTFSDWSTRPRYWPSVADAKRVMSLGCHLVPKFAPYDKEQTSWRFSFSLAEVELSKLVPETARKCYLALKIILKDHLQPVVPEIGSYHIKTIFLNTLEKLPVGFWVEDNIEECFLTLLAELRDALASMKCPHHWFGSINLFGSKAKKLQLLAKKVDRILKDPAPFLFDDGCRCLSPCCVRVPQNSFIRRGSEQFLVDYDELAVVVDGEVASPVQNPCSHIFLSAVPESPRSDALLESRLCRSGEHGQCITTTPEEPVISLPTQTILDERTWLLS